MIRRESTAQLLMRLISSDLQQTRAIGTALASVLTAGDVIALNGDLGAGKTHLVQAIAVGLGVPLDEVNSPTFVLIQEYEGRVPICHIDAYRLADSDEFLELGADELLGAENVCLIEWASRVADVLPRDQLTIKILVTGESSRELELSAGGPRSKKLLKNLEDRIGTTPGDA